MKTFTPDNRFRVPPSHQRSCSTTGDARLLSWWYRQTSPPEPGEDASFQQREVFRRGRTGSQMSFFLFLLLFLSFPAAFAGSNPLLVTILVLNGGFLVVAMLLNRLQRVTLAGVIVVLGVVMGPVVNILTTPGGITTSALPLFGFLVLPLLCAVSFLPPGWVFVVAAGTSLFTFVTLKFLPSSGEVQQMVQVAFAGMVTPILLSQWIVAIVAYLWVRGAQRAILRADRAEEIARLMHELAERDAAIAEQKHQLDASLREIERVHHEVANGNVAARVHLTSNNVLWSISGKLNNLVSRYQRVQTVVGELQEANALLLKAREGEQHFVQRRGQGTSLSSHDSQRQQPPTF